MLAEMILAAALTTAKDLSSGELVRYYWDCDTNYMKGEMHPGDLLPCIEITEELKQRVWQGDDQQFRAWWNQRKEREWFKRGYYPEHRPEK